MLGSCIARSRSCSRLSGTQGRRFGRLFLLPQVCCWAVLGNDARCHDDWSPLRLSDSDLGQKIFYNCHCPGVVGHINVANGLLLGNYVDIAEVQRSSSNVHPNNINVGEELEVEMTH